MGTKGRVRTSKMTRKRKESLKRILVIAAEAKRRKRLGLPNPKEIIIHHEKPRISESQETEKNKTQMTNTSVILSRNHALIGNSNTVNNIVDSNSSSDHIVRCVEREGVSSKLFREKLCGWRSFGVKTWQDWITTGYFEESFQKLLGCIKMTDDIKLHRLIVNLKEIPLTGRASLNLRNKIIIVFNFLIQMKKKLENNKNTGCIVSLSEEISKQFQFGVSYSASSIRKWVLQYLHFGFFSNPQNDELKKTAFEPKQQSGQFGGQFGKVC